MADDDLVTVIRGDDPLYIFGDAIEESIGFGHPGITIKRAYWDGEKLVTEYIDPLTFYTDKP
jgi:hypothetical protein